MPCSRHAQSERPVWRTGAPGAGHTKLPHSSGELQYSHDRRGVLAERNPGADQSRTSRLLEHLADGRRPAIGLHYELTGRAQQSQCRNCSAGYQGGVSLFVTNTTNVILDIDGYYAPPSGQTLQFFPLSPCRVLDTRTPNGPLGGPSLNGGQQRDFPVLSSDCPIPSSAAAYSMNFTVVPVSGPLGYLTVWPTGQPQPVVSTLNNPTATTVANAALVPSGTGGDISVYASQSTQLVADIDGYFAPAAQGGLSLYPAAPCRVLDTRSGNGPFMGELTVNVAGSVCAPPSVAQAYVFNATVVPSGHLGYLTLWPDGVLPACGLDFECPRWSDHVKHGDCAHDQRGNRCVCVRSDAAHPGHLQLLRTIALNAKLSANY